MMDNKNLMMSFDLTSGEPNTKLRCRKGHRYDDKGTIEGRNYFLLVLGCKQLKAIITMDDDDDDDNYDDDNDVDDNNVLMITMFMITM